MDIRYFIMIKDKNKDLNNQSDEKFIQTYDKNIYILPEININYYNKNGLSEKNLIEWCKQFGSKQYNFIDIGAHTGTYTISLASLFNHVYSFEPQKQTYYALCGSVALSGYNNVTCINSALGSSDIKNMNKLKIRSVDGGGSSLFYLGDIILNEEIIQMNVLDDYKFENISFIKLDVEDCEYYVLKGGKDTINLNHPKILFECNNSGDITRRNLLFSLLTDEYKYKIIKLSGIDNMYIAEY